MNPADIRRLAVKPDAEVEALQRAPIDGKHPYLYLDATFVNARWARKERRRDSTRAETRRERASPAIAGRSPSLMTTYKAREPPLDSRFATDSGGGTRTPDTRIMIPLL